MALEDGGLTTNASDEDDDAANKAATAAVTVADTNRVMVGFLLVDGFLLLLDGSMDEFDCRIVSYLFRLFSCCCLLMQSGTGCKRCWCRSWV